MCALQRVRQQNKDTIDEQYNESGGNRRTGDGTEHSDKIAIAIFVVSFIMLGYLGTQPTTDLYKLLAQIGTVLYFLFFLLMPIYSKLDKTKPVPERVTK